MPRLTNAQYEIAIERSKMSNVPLNVCPTCGSADIFVNEDVFGRENGTYRFRGEEHECDCETQMELRKHYLVANIGDQYMRLDWADYSGPQRIKDNVATYLDSWEVARINGMGLEFGGKGLGVGKTFGATHVGKELIKRGEKVFFLPFLEVISLYARDDDSRSYLHDTLRTTTVLILDEVLPPMSERQGSLFAAKFEELIRHRTNFNLVTIITTNVEAESLDELYPRTYSLLAAKQLRIDLTGADQRRNHIQWENLELLANKEVRPIT